MSSAQQSEVKAWEEEILACEHTLTLEQTPFINPEDPRTLVGLRDSVSLHQS
jgi:ubiquitin carboxyl-terminal hydrolase 5/13